MRQRRNIEDFSSCIIARAKFHLRIPNGYRHNEKPCSDNYWNNAIDVLTRLHRVPESRIRRARRMKNVFR